MHNKFIIADDHDPNTLIIHDQRVTNIFRQEFEARWGELDPASVLTSYADAVKVYPNPASALITLDNPFTSSCDVELINVNGQIVIRKDIEANQTSVLTFDQSLPAGVYMVRMVSGAQPCRVFTIVIQ